MGLFGFLRQNKKEISDEQKKWNKIWQLWEAGKAESPYAELMTYQSEINNGGHEQYFLNLTETGNLQRELKAVSSALSEKLKNNLHTAYGAYLVSEKRNDETAEDTLAQCDDVYYENEAEIDRLLKEYADRIER